MAMAMDHVGAVIVSDDQLSESFRQAMRRVASTVNVISIRVDGRPMGITATAVSSISLEPSSLLVCINRAASLHAPMGDMSHFRVNVLHHEQIEVARMFADRSQHAIRFNSGWDIPCAGAPRLVDAQATILCRRIDSHSFGTHSIFIGVVEEADWREDVDPLIYLDGDYCRGTR
ncbi:MAG: flavin reductase family protein [Allosphingosinicella sp.]